MEKETPYTTMASEEETQAPRRAEESEEMEIYNQMGDPQVIAMMEEEIRTDIENIRAEGPRAEVEQVSATVPQTEKEQIRAEGPQPKSELQMLYELMKEDNKKLQNKLEISLNKLQEDNKKIREDIQDIKVNQKKLEEKVEANQNKLEVAIKDITGKHTKLREEIKNDMNTLHDKLVGDIQIVNKTWREELNKTEHNFGEVVQQQSEKFKCEIQKTTKNLSENLNRINQEVRREIKTTKEVVREEVRNISTVNKEEMEEQLRKLAEEKGRRIDEMKEDQEQLKRKLTELESRPMVNNQNTIVANQEQLKEVRYNGRDAYPMEFLKELKEVKEIYYPSGGIKWISRHLEGEATVWWRIVQSQIHTFEQFEEAFTKKFWSQQIQENIRDSLEYGCYYPNGKLTMVQYLENKILQCRQLIPPISDQHLIRKLARHYSKEIEVAIITRGVQQVDQFESLLNEFATIQQREMRGSYRQPQQTTVDNGGRHINNGYHKTKGMKVETEHEGHRPGWRNKQTFGTEDRGTKQPIVNTVTIERQQPGPSQESRTKNDQPTHCRGNNT